MSTNCIDLLDNFHKKPDTNHTLVLISYRWEEGTRAMPRSVLEAIKMGIWDFEPQDVAAAKYEPANAMPGTREKLSVLAERARRGLPLWHVNDRDDMESPPPAAVRKRR